MDDGPPLFELETRETVRLILGSDRDAAKATPELIPIVYKDLKRLAQWRMRGEAPGHTLQATALVHEAYLRLLGTGSEVTWENRRHFIAAAAEAMRRILIERARRKSRLKRGGGHEHQSTDELDSIASPVSATDPTELLSLDAALSRLESTDEQAALIAKLRHLAGYSVQEVAEALDISERSVVRKWALARAWLLRELEAE